MIVIDHRIINKKLIVIILTTTIAKVEIIKQSY